MEKLGPHIQNIAKVDAAGWAWINRAPIVKSIDGTLALRVAKPSAIRVYRKYYPFQDEAAKMGGKLLAQEIIDSLHGYRHPALYVEFPFNEWRSALSELPEHIALLEEGLPVFHAAGLRVCGFNFATGNPPEFMEAWDYIKSRNYGGLTDGDAIGQHCYWGAAGPVKSQWNARRYEIDHNLLGSGHPPIIITECGRDAVKEDGSEGVAGWHKQELSPEQYVSEISTYDVLLSKVPYVLGACLFTLGANDDWRHFEVDSIAKYLHDVATPAPVAPNVPPATQAQAGGEKKMALDFAKLAVYADWAKARLANKEDSRDVSAFLAHLRRLGCDYTRPMDYGLPYVEVSPKA